MDIKTYHASSLQEALRMVRAELGPDASVLHTREVTGGPLSWLKRSRQIEVTASRTAQVPSRLPTTPSTPPVPSPSVSATRRSVEPAHLEETLRDNLRQVDRSQGSDLLALAPQGAVELAGPAMRLLAELTAADVPEPLARELMDQVQQRLSPSENQLPHRMRARLRQTLESQIVTGGPIQVASGQRRMVALVGPTGVGKTTTIAKLAANFRLRADIRVGLITVDTYRIAAVDQLRTYAEIIDLPMEVVSTPREMRAAVDRMQDVDLVLLDTAGRSPRDEIRIQELKAILTEAHADEVHLVLSVTGGARQLATSAQRFSVVGTTALLLTKLDEAAGLGNLLPTLQQTKLPVSYLTHGQRVPDDIAVADRQTLSTRMLSANAESLDTGGQLAFSNRF